MNITAVDALRELISFKKEQFILRRQVHIQEFCEHALKAHQLPKTAWKKRLTFGYIANVIDTIRQRHGLKQIGSKSHYVPKTDRHGERVRFWSNSDDH